MEINNPPYSIDYIKEKNGQLLYCKLIPLTGWNMDLNPGHSEYHGLDADYIKIISVEIWITNDAGNGRYPLTKMANLADPSLLNGGIASINPTSISLNRRTDGYFDSVNFDDSGISRGSMLIWYIR